MFILDGKPLSPDRAFTHAGIQYPANWLRLSSLAEKQAIGIIEVPDPPVWDQRFYWSPDLPKDHAQLVEQWVAQTKDTAASLLNRFDWYIVRQAETGKAVPQEVLDYRAAVRVVSDNREVMITGTIDTDQLVAVITGDFNGLFPWPADPFAPTPEPIQVEDGADTIIFSSETTSAFSGGATSGQLVM